MAAAGGGAAIGATVLEALKALFAPIVNWIMGPVSRILTGFFAWITMSAFHAMVDFAPEESRLMIRKVVDAFTTYPDEYGAFVEAYFSNMFGIPYPRLKPEEITTRVTQDMGNMFLTPMLNFILPGGYPETGVPRFREVGIQPQDGLRAAERYLSVNLHFQMSAWLLHVLGDTMSFGMWKAMKDLPNAISWSYGLGWLSWLVMGVPFRITIADPMEIYFNELYRPAKWTRAELVKFLMMGAITQAEFKKGMAGLGYSDEKIVHYLNIDREKLTRADMRRLLRVGTHTVSDVTSELQSQGYWKDTALTLAQTIDSEVSDDILDKIAMEALKHYEDDLLDWPTCGRFLEFAHYKPNERELWKTLYDLRKSTPPGPILTERRLSPANIGNLFKTRKVDASTAATLWQQANVDLDQLGYWFLLYEPAEVKEPEPRELSTSIVGSLYKRGEIEAEEARRLWTSIDWSSEQATYLLRYYKPIPPVLPPPVPLTTSQVGRLYSTGYFTTGEALARLTVSPRPGLEEEDARLLLEAFYQPAPPEEEEPRKLSATVVGALYRAQILPRGDTEIRWASLGYAPEDVSALIQYYAPPIDVPVPEPLPFAIAPANVARLWSEKAITLTEAVDRLVQVPLDKNDVLLYLRLSVPEPDWIRTARDYVEAVISAGTAKAQWLAKGLPEIDFSLFLDMYRVAPWPDWMW